MIQPSSPAIARIGFLGWEATAQMADWMPYIRVLPFLSFLSIASNILASSCTTIAFSSATMNSGHLKLAAPLSCSALVSARGCLSENERLLIFALC
jgi:hypothetical protein